ncbi:MAG: pentapeptide repeat-containing protein [Paludisphaera borealis]|uniref:pentapeptide repeat-containing protein n=1 Tax=Paludisphaera borealis TaxID=1387353 RepID=UPI00284A759A|nr:pentapeptide repeat-containing protein [Paludisphaera borealis]MDR3619091.1 pentapeptide repeat-containing protein [Paludisphaera borealis]
MKHDLPSRLSYSESCRFLQDLGHLEEGLIPPVPERRPEYDDEEPLGICFFRTSVGEGDMEHLSLPRTYFGRSDVGPISFKNTDLSESTLCWNDFNEVDFTDADLSRSDLRGSLFNKVAFVRADLRDADLRRSTFEDCDFTEADMRGARLTREQGKHLPISDKQSQEIDWQDSDGDEPPGD